MARKPKARKAKTAMMRLNMFVEQKLLDDIDDFRKQQPGISPNRSDVIRSLLQWALRNYPAKTPLEKLEDEK